jgi:Neocarzinostatin family
VNRHGIGTLAVAGLLAACSGGSSIVVRPPDSTTPASTTSASVSGSSAGPRHPQITVTPDRGLRDGQRVRVSGRDFAPDEALQVIQCADKGDSTGPGDCNLAAMLAASSDANGRVSATLPVARGPFGANRVVCAAAVRCLISVTQASLTPTDEADAEITFTPR